MMVRRCILMIPILAAVVACDVPEPTPEEQAENRRKGFHCLSSWDGSHRDFVRQVRARLNDPDSFEHDETRVTPVSDEGTHLIFMEFRARNAFGGIVRNTARGSYRQSGCQSIFFGLN